MMRNKRVCVNIYNFIRMSHTEPTRFIQDDFDTIRNQIITVKQYGFSGTYALKYDALMEPKYQALLKEYLDESDEISAWWEITRELCERSGVRFRSNAREETYDDRVDSAYSIGYSPDERKKLVDGYMADFYTVFGKYPQSIGSWVLDSVTMEYAAQRYGVSACAICRDQMGVDGFTLWGGYPNGAYYPSRKNENIPAQIPENQIPIPVFRLLGPDPIYNFEADVRDGLHGVFTLEPAWLVGRDPKWIRWMFENLTEEDTLGMAYAHVGQENNFLWENIKPGFAPQLEVLRELSREGKLCVETMADTAAWFREKYRVTPPTTFQASMDWDKTRNLNCQWYASSNYRVGLLGENGHLRIRDLFVYCDDYESRYLRGPMKGIKSTFDALPVLFPQLWKPELGYRPFIHLLAPDGFEPEGRILYRSLEDDAVEAVLQTKTGDVSIVLHSNSIVIWEGYSLIMDALPVFTSLEGNTVHMCHEGFSYSFRVEAGKIVYAGKDGVRIDPDEGRIRINLEQKSWDPNWYTQQYLKDPESVDDRPMTALMTSLEIPAIAPEFIPGESVFAYGEPAVVSMHSADAGVIRYTTDGSEPTDESSVYDEPIEITEDCVLSARLYTPDGRCSDVTKTQYRFGLKNMRLESPTVLDSRPVFTGNGMRDLLEPLRGSLDYLDGVWRGTLQDVDVTCVLAVPASIASIAIGFLSHHRSGIVYPQWVELYVGNSSEDLSLLEHQELPWGPCEREITKRDVYFSVHKKVGAFRLVAHRYPKMPGWCTYYGSPAVFTMTDNILVIPE